MQQLFFLFVYIVESFIAYLYFSDNFETKFGLLSSLFAGAAMYLPAFILNNVLSNNILVNLIAFLVINIIYGIVMFKISMKNAVFHSSVLTAIMFFTENIIIILISNILGIPINSYKNNLFILVIAGLLSKVVYLIIAKLISLLFSNKKNNISKEVKKNFALFLYPLIITIMLALFLYAAYNYSFSENMNITFALVSALSLIFSCFIFVLNQRLQIRESDLLHLKTEQQKTEINKTFYELLEQKNEDQRVLVHDIKHHFAVLGMMNDIDEVKKYIAEIQPAFEKYQYIGKSKNKMLDLIINKYSYICKTRNIRFSVDVRSNNLDFMADSDLTSLLSNLLDNAVDAANGAADAEIRFSTKKENHFYVLSVVNTSVTVPKSSGERLFTTKEDNKIHGYGIKSIERVAKKYHGICDWNYDHESNTFHYNIVFNQNH